MLELVLDCVVLGGQNVDLILKPVNASAHKVLGAVLACRYHHVISPTIVGRTGVWTTGETGYR